MRHADDVARNAEMVQTLDNLLLQSRQKSLVFGVRADCIPAHPSRNKSLSIVLPGNLAPVDCSYGEGIWSPGQQLEGIGPYVKRRSLRYLDLQSAL